MLSASDVRAAFAHAGGLRVSWLGVAVAAEVASLVGGAAAAAVCRRCIAALADRVRRGNRLHRAGQGDAGRAGRRGRLAGRGVPGRGAGAAARLRAVLAGGFTSTVAISGLLLAGAAVAGTGSLALLAGAAGVLASGTARLAAAAHHAGTLSRWLSRRHHRSPTQRSSCRVSCRSP
jgi:hypothetical protein